MMFCIDRRGVKDSLQPFCIENVIILYIENAFLICSKDKAQNVKDILKELKRGKVEYL